MTFLETTIDRAFLIEPDVFLDERGAFVHLHSERDLAARGVTASFLRTALSWNRRAGTLRGMHLQVSPHADAKLVTCVRGAIYDVIVDVRRRSETYGQWEAFDLSADNKRLLYIPEGVAHGFQTRENESVVLYHLSQYYVPEASTGFRWDDPAVGVSWPEYPTVISEKDRRLGGIDVLAFD